MFFKESKRKTVILMRHGKSSWADFNVGDHERQLLDVGIKKTKKVAVYLKDKNIFPDMILSSTATRAFETAKIIASQIGYPIDKIKTSKNIYHAGADEIFDEIFQFDNDIESVMIFGHNPTFTDFVNIYQRPQIDNLPTSAVASISFKTDKWENVPMAKAKMEFLISPKMLK